MDFNWGHDLSNQEQKVRISNIAKDIIQKSLWLLQPTNQLWLALHECSAKDHTKSLIKATMTPPQPFAIISLQKLLSYLIP